MVREKPVHGGQAASTVTWPRPTPMAGQTSAGSAVARSASTGARPMLAA